MTRTIRPAILLYLLSFWTVFGCLRSTTTEEPEWKTLFDGASLTAWRSYESEEPPEGWRIEEDALYRAEGGGDIMTVEQFGDFELTCEWKIGPGGNSGIIYRVSTGEAAPYMSGPEYQLIDNPGSEDVEAAITATGSLYGLYATDFAAVKPAGEWNTTKIVLRGNHLEHWLNGTRVVECVIHSDDWNQRVAESKFADWEAFGQNPSGYIVLQDHGDEVWYRNIKIRELAGD